MNNGLVWNPNELNICPATFAVPSFGIKIDALQRFFDGRVRHIVPQADQRARTFPIDVEIDNREKLVASGMFARATVIAGPVQQVVAVPKDAIVQQGGVDNVAVVVPGAQGATMGVLMGVTVGADVGDWITITSGNVAPGMRVITRGNENIQPFPSPIQIVDEKGSPVGPPPGSPEGDSRMSHKEGT